MLARSPSSVNSSSACVRCSSTVGAVAEPPADVAKVVVHVGERDRVAEAVRAGQRRALQRGDVLYLAAALQDR